MQACPLCGGDALSLWHQDARREYWRCAVCELVSVPPAFHLDAVQEKALYDQHENDPADAGYRKFLNRLAQPLLARLPAACEGLDFGCGPGPALAQLLEEVGHSVALYDKFYWPDETVLLRRYDFVTATELVEHLADPRATWQLFHDLLEPGGWLGIMTKRVRDQAAFSRWHYIHDPTHVSFYSDATFHWIAQRWGFVCTLADADVVLLQKAL